MSVDGAERLRKFADLAVRIGANVGEGQYVYVNGLVEHAPLVRAIVDAAYDAGAKHVDVFYGDMHVRRSRVEKAPEELLDYVSPFLVKALEDLGAEQGAMISITDVGIIISNGKGADITMVGPSVTINQGALAVI